MQSIISSDVAIVGGGPAGSSLAILLRKHGFSVSVFEKKQFPREVLCGEFLSHEVTDFIKAVGLEKSFLSLNPNPIKSFTLSGSHKIFTHNLTFTGYGLSRGAFDKLLLDHARSLGAGVFEQHEVTDIYRESGTSFLKGNRNGKEFSASARYIIGAYGKQSFLDKNLSRKHFRLQTKYFGVKYHIPLTGLQAIQPGQIVIAAANNIYCGINVIEGGNASLCFLARSSKEITDRKSALRYLTQNNPLFSEIIEQTRLLTDDEPRVYGTGSIYFGAKNFSSDGVIFSGDSAQVIPPLAGDGIGMALENANMLSELIARLLDNSISEETFKHKYAAAFHKLFNRRLITAGFIQKLVFNGFLRNPGISLLNLFPSLYPVLERNTRKRP